MTRHVGSTGSDAKLDPLRWPRPPRRGTVLRAALVAALLITAAGVLYGRDDGGACSGSPAPAAGSGPPPTPAASLPVPGRLALPPGLVGVPVRLAEPTTVAVVAAGDRVDLLATRPSGTAGSGQPTLLAASALVLGTLDAADADPVAGSALLYLALSPDQARNVVGMPENVRFGVIVRP